jgi:hypothetical protein
MTAGALMVVAPKIKRRGVEANSCSTRGFHGRSERQAIAALIETGPTSTDNIVGRTRDDVVNGTRQ